MSKSSAMDRMGDVLLLLFAAVRRSTTLRWPLYRQHPSPKFKQPVEFTRRGFCLKHSNDVSWCSQLC